MFRQPLALDKIRNHCNHSVFWKLKYLMVWYAEFLHCGVQWSTSSRECQGRRWAKDESSETTTSKKSKWSSWSLFIPFTVFSIPVTFKQYYTQMSWSKRFEHVCTAGCQAQHPSCQSFQLHWKQTLSTYLQWTQLGRGSVRTKKSPPWLQAYPPSSPERIQLRHAHQVRIWEGLWHRHWDSQTWYRPDNMLSFAVPVLLPYFVIVNNSPQKENFERFELEP